MFINQPFHLVSPSTLPFNIGIATFNFMLSLVSWFHNYNNFGLILLFSFIIILLNIIIWFREILLESDLGYHTDMVKKGLIFGVWLMIISEATFFMGLMWASIHTGLTPTISLQMIWPPIGIEPITWYQRSLVMTFVLASSFCTANICSYALLSNNRFLLSINLLITIVMGILFLMGQYVEYTTAPFTITDSIFGNTFYLSTGYHGLHVLVAVLYLLICFFNISKITIINSISLHISILIYHIVDIVWLVVFGLLYVAVL
jgi:cytochrome c oxidase subunit 3